MKKSSVAFSLLVAALLIVSIPDTLQAYAQTLPQPSEQQIIQSISGPVFQNAYWTDASATGTAAVRKEVGPGDGASTLAVVLVNRGFSDITSVKGTLSLPAGFAPNSISPSSGKAVATYDDVVGGGDAFTLLFDISVLDSAKVGSYSVNLDVEYSNILEIGSFHHSYVIVPFRLTGKVVLEPATVTRNLVPGVTNNVEFEIRNAGSAPATGVTATITGITSSATATQSQTSQAQVANLGSRTYSLETIPAGSSAKFTSSIFPTIGASGTLAGVQLEITYNDAYGNSKTITPTVGMVIQQTAQSLIGVKAVGQGEGRPDNQITAGKVDDFMLEISNKGDAPIEHAVISIAPRVESINILGDSKWTVSSIAPSSTVNLSTSVFAPTSLIGTSTAFDVSIDYLLGGESKSEKLALGTYVDGEITIRAYDLAINYIGNTPNLVGNLLNEGNTGALFTTIEIVPSAQGRQLTASGAQQQYLGDLTENSPLPFSIPLSARGLEQGTYPVTLKITYKDDLRNTHELTTSANVALEQSTPTSQTAGQGQRFAGQSPVAGLTLPLIIAGIAAAVAAFVVLRRRRAKVRKASVQESEDDITTMLNNPGTEQTRASDAKGPDGK